MREVPSGVADLRTALLGLGWVTELFVSGSLASGDYRPGVSDIDLVALTSGPVDGARLQVIHDVHLLLDRGAASGLKLGCAYVDGATLTDIDAPHPTWTHGAMVTRPLSDIARVELAAFGFSLLGRAPRAVFPEVDADWIRRAARSELNGYWSLAAGRPWWWLDRTMIDLGLTSMARGRHALDTGQLLTKTAAVDVALAPPWLIDQLRARRDSADVRSPLLRSAWYAWRDARRTTAFARRHRTAGDAGS